MAANKTNRAVVIKAKGEAEVTEVSVPKLRDEYMLVRTTAVAINPTDWKHVDGFGGPTLGARIGCDYAGVVLEVGPKVIKNFKKGDRVCGLAHGGNSSQTEDGAFANIIVVKGDLQIKIPDGMSDTDAATLGVAITTVGQGLYQALKLPLPTQPAVEPFPVLIYGGSTAMGVMGIQFAKLSGCTVVVTCSPHNFEYVRSLGADAVFDYRAPDCAARIRKATGGYLRYAWDCIASAESARICAAALADDSEGAVYRSLLIVDTKVLHEVNPGIDNGATISYTVFGEPFTKEPFAEGCMRWEASTEDLKFGEMFWELSRELLTEGKVKAIRTIVNQGGSGLEGVLQGLDDLRGGKVSGGKLVYAI
ncbi:hypothetical protein FALCPG4_016051 [Fusarium falciforme]